MDKSRRAFRASHGLLLLLPPAHTPARADGFRIVRDANPDELL